MTKIYTRILVVLFTIGIFEFANAATFYSQASNQLFSNLSNWNTNPGGGGTSPLAADLTSGSHSFVIQNTHNITLDQNISVAALTVGGGASGRLTIGNDATARTITISGNLSVLAGATLNVGAFDAVHSLTVSGNISNNGTFNLVATPVTRVCNLVMDGTGFPTITGTQTPVFNNFTISAGAAGADISRAITVSGDFLVTNTTPVTIAQSATITGSFTVAPGSTFTASGGTITFNNASSQTIDVNNAAFYAMLFGGSGNKTIVGNITATNLVTLGAGITVNDAGGVHTITGGLTINNNAVLNFTGTVNFAGNLSTGYDYSTGGVTNMGTATWNFTGNVNTVLIGGALAGQFNFAGDLAVNAGTFTINNNTGIVSAGADFSLNNSSSMYIAGLTKPSGGITNFPAGFTAYTIGSTTTVRYSMAGDQVVTAGAAITYGNLQLYNNTKTVSGSPLTITGTLTLNNVNANLLGTDVILNGSVANTGACTLTNDQTFTLDNNVNQILNAGAVYNFHNLIIAQTTTPVASRTKTIATNITVDGDFTATNTGGSDVILNIIDLQANAILDGSPSGTFTLGSNAQLNISGATASEFQATLNSFTTIALDATPANQSRVRFNNTANGTIQVIPNSNTSGSFSYGNIELNGSGSGNTKQAGGSLDINGNIIRVGGTTVFDDGNFNHTVAGDWLLPNNVYTTPGATATITFDGTDPQQIGSGAASYQFRNIVIANTAAVVSLNFNTGYVLTILGDLTINNGATLDAGSRAIGIAGNWVQLGTGIFTQTGTTTFNGTAANQTISIATPATSYFGNLTITKKNGGAPQTLTALTGFTVNGNFVYTANSAVFDATNQTVKVGGNWTMNSATSFISTGSTLILFGNTAQTITNSGTTPTYNNIVCTGAGVKSFSNSAITVNGNMDITGATVTWGGAAVLTLNGDWINTGNTGVFNPSTGTLLLNGAAQNIGNGPFYNITAAGSNGSTKVLTDNIVLNNSITINSAITVDVSGSNYNLNVGGSWTNNGQFTCRTGTVTFTGSTNATVSTGTAAGFNTGNNFYILIINKATSAYNVNFPAGSDLTVLNDFTVTTGRVNLQTSADGYFGGNFFNNDVFTVNNAACVINLTASSGTKNFDPGTSVTSSYRNIIVNSTATYQLSNDLNVTSGGVFTLTSGNFLLNGKTMSFTGAAASGTSVIVVGAGTFDVDSGATLKLSNQTVITINNASSVFKVVGSPSDYASVTTNGNSTTGYTINQSAGVFHAKYYTFSNLRTTGITLSGTTTIDATNNFSNGIFTSPASTGLTQYLDVSGIALGTLTPVYTVFNAGTAGTKNVKADAGTTGYIEFSDPSGVLQGVTFENDDGVAATGKVRWAYHGHFWTDAGNDGDWFNTANWNVGSLPTASDNVYIDHSIKVGAFSNPVTVNAAGAVTNNLTVDAGGGAAITINIAASGVLTSSGNVSVLTNNVLTFTGGGIFNIQKAFSYAGAASAPSNGTVAFTGTAGTNVITAGNFSFYNLTVNGNGATYALGSTITANNNITLTDGILDVTGANYAITCKGNWIVGSGIFSYQQGTVYLNKAGTSTQTISNGNFYNLIIDNTTAATTATKVLLSPCVVFGSLTIGNGGAGVAQLNSGNYDLSVAGNWTNNCVNGYISTGITTLNGISGTQTVSGTQPSAFNTLILSNAATKNITTSQQINGDLQVSSSSGQVSLAAAAIITDAGGTNTFSIPGNTVFIVYGTFPAVFETVSLSAGSTVRYQANGAQSVYSVASPGYGNLQLYANNSGTATTKTALGNIYLQTGITIGNGATDDKVTLDMSNNSMTLSGSVFTQQTGAPQVIWGTGTMTQNGGGWSIDADITGFNNLIVGGTGNKTMLADLNLITGDVTIQIGATLVMGSRTMTCTGSSKILSIQNGATLTCAITASVAFPTGFATYALNPASTVTLNGAGDQTIMCSNVTYGNLNLSPTAIANETLTNHLTCAGDFGMNNNATLVDAGYNMLFTGTNIDIRTYNPTLATSTITLGGSAQNFYSGNGGNFTVGNVVFSGVSNSSKSLGSRSGVANNVVYISGNVIIDPAITVTCTRNVFYSGANWTNNGTFSHTAGLYTFNGAVLQTINPGANNVYYSVAVSNVNNPGVLVTANGMNITSTTVINSNARFDMGGSAAPAATLAHTFGGSVTNNGYWITTNANLVLNGGGYAVPVNDAVTPATTFIARNVTIGNGTKSMAATTTWQVDDLTINSGAVFNPGAAANTINVKGNWTCNGTFTHNNNTVNFNGDGSVNTAAVAITVNTSSFFKVNFSPTGAAVAYTLQSSSTTILSDMTLASLGTLNLNGSMLTLGANAATVKTYTVNGILNIDANASLRFNNQGSNVAGVSQCVMNVSGASAKLKLVGASNSAVATITAVTGGTQAAGYYTAITITGGAEIEARYYSINYLADAGMVVTSTAVINNTNNFSDGSWSNMNTAAAGAAKRYYLDVEAPAPSNTIANVTFNYAVSPVPANRFNVKRTAALTTIEFVDVISGALGSYLYEEDDLSATTGRIKWPPLLNANWIGAVSSNFNDGANWSTGATPTINTNCIVGAVVAPNVSPVIDATSGAAICKSLTLTNGRLDMSGNVTGIDLEIQSYVYIGTTGIAVLNVSASDVTIQVGGNWTRGATAGTSFIHGNGTVIFNGTSGSYTIDPQVTGNCAFGNVIFNGISSSYSIARNLTATGNFTINDATILPAANTITISGDYTNNNGVFTANALNASTVVLNKAGNQSVYNATFYNLTVSGSGTKTFFGNADVFNNTVINNGTTLKAPSGAEVLTLCSGNTGTVTINSGGMFDDNGGDHIFKGSNWIATTASYTGSGSMTFSRNNAQTITGAQFNDLRLTNAGNVTVNGDVAILGGVDVYFSPSSTLVLNNNYKITGSGTGTFILGANQTMNVNGSDNCPSGFGAYVFDPTSTTNYTQPFDQIVGGITYGNLILNTATVKTLNGDITVLGNLNINTSTLDVSANNYDITVSGNFNNNGTGSLLSNGAPHAGEIVLNGTAAQNIAIGSTGAKAIYNLTLNKTTGTTATVQTNNITILNNLTVQRGTFSLGNLIGNIAGNVTVVNSNGSIATSGTINLNAASGARTIQLSGSNLNIVTVNASGVTYTAQDNISVYGNFSINAGTFDGNGKYVNVGNSNNKTLLIAAGATYKTGAGGTLAMGSNGAVSVAGTIEIIGTDLLTATVTKINAGNSYVFDVTGTIKARYYLFEYMAASGIVINSSATIDATNNFSDGTFSNGPANCKYITFLNTQTLTINNVLFSTAPSGSSNNAVKSTAGVITFYNATGIFAGATYEGDDGVAATGAIRWTGPETLNWIGAVSTDWYTPGNWASSLGGNGIPDATKNAVIATNPSNRHPLIDGSGGAAICKNLTINSTMVLTVTTGAGTGDLVVNGDIQINGEIRASSSNDYIEVTGNWVKAAAGTVNLTAGTVTFTGTGNKQVNNGTGTFNNITVNNSGLAAMLGSNTIVNGDLTIINGMLDVTGSAYALTVKGNWINNGTFNSRVGTAATVTLSSSGSGAVILNSGSSSFNNLIIAGAASTVYTLTTNNLSVAGQTNINSGELNLNSLTFNVGDNAGTDPLNVNGILNVNQNAYLKMGTNASVSVNSGGTIKIVGTSGNNATVTKQSAGSAYAFTVNSGGTIYAQYYLFEYMNAAGILVNAGATINPTDNFSNGTFSNGYSGGKFLVLRNNFSDYTVTGATFNTGPAYSVSRTLGTGVISFDSPTGPLANYLYEEDDNSPTTGLVRWSYINPKLFWIGVASTDWQNPANWSTTDPPGPPDLTTDVIITSGTPYQPVLTANAMTRDFTMTAGSTLDMEAYNFVVAGKFTNNGGAFSSTGTVEMATNSGTVAIDPGASSFYNLVISGAANFTTTNAITITNDFTINNGSAFAVANASHTITIGGSWTSTGATFTHGNGTVVFNKNSGVSSLITGPSGAGGATFYNLSIIQETPSPVQTKTQTLTGNLTVAGTFSVSSAKCVFSCGTNNTVELSGMLTIGAGATLMGGSATIYAKNNWTNNVGNAFNYGTSTVVLDGNNAQTITRGTGAGETFYNLTINNAAGVVCAKPVVVYGTLALSNGLVTTSAAGALTMAAGSTTTTGTANSYIAGPMIYEVAANGLSTINFPVGKATSWRPVVLAVTHSSNASVKYTTELFNSSAKALGYPINGTTLTEVSSTRYWQIDRSNVANLTNAIVTLYYKTAGLPDGVTDPDNLRIAKTIGEGTMWYDAGGTGTASGTGTITSGAFTSFSKFTLANANGGFNPLPIELVSFTAIPVNKEVKLEWVTMSERNNDYFTVERSVNGINFEAVAIVDGAGNSTGKRAYQAKDRHPSNGLNYYRLKQTDFNGEYTYSAIIYVMMSDAAKLSLNVYPNPLVQDDLYIIINGADERVNVTMHDVIGKQYYNKDIQLDGDNRSLIIKRDNSMLPGVYFIVVSGNTEVYTQRIIVQ